MELTTIHGTGIRASRIALGTWSIGGWMWGGTDAEEAVATLRTAFERGITTVDTAPVYGFGTAERRVGRALAEHGRRDEVVRVWIPFWTFRPFSGIKSRTTR